MIIGERILLSLSRALVSNDYQLKESEITLDTALDLLQRAYPNLCDLVSGRRVADFGCGIGYQSVALVQKLRLFGRRHRYEQRDI